MSTQTRYAFCWIAVVISLFALNGTARAQEAVWRQNIVHIRCKDSTFEQALEQVAAQANISIVTDGIPLSKSFTLEAELPAEKALSQIADAFDCSWNVSKSGIVLLRKRFTNEHERPQVVPAEMRASLRDLLSFIQGVYAPKPGKSLSDSFRKLQANLPPDALKLFNSNAGLPVRMLTPDLQQQAIQIILQNQLDTAETSLQRLDRQLASLPESVLTTEDRPSFGGKTFNYITLNFNSASGLPYEILWRRDEKAEAQETPSVPASALSASAQVKTLTIEQLRALLDTQFHLKLTLLPKIDERLVLLKLKDTDASNVPSALAELYNWTLQQPDRNTFYLLRRQVSMPQSMAEWGKAILQALPADVSKCWSTRPMTLNDEPYIDVNKLHPGLPHPENFTKGLISAKTFVQLRDSLRYLRHSARNETFAQPRPYTKLSSELQRELAYHLYYYMLSQCQGDLLNFIYYLPSLVADPLNARLASSGDGFRMTGSGGGSVMVSEGPPVKAN